MLMEQHLPFKLSSVLVEKKYKEKEQISPW